MPLSCALPIVVFHHFQHLLVVYSIHKFALKMPSKKETLLVFSTILLLKLTSKMISLWSFSKRIALNVSVVLEDVLAEGGLGVFLDEEVLEDVLAE